MSREGRREGTPRDSFLRPMVDLEGAKARLGFNTQKATMELEEEFDENRWESQEALKYAGKLPGGSAAQTIIRDNLESRAISGASGGW